MFIDLAEHHARETSILAQASEKQAVGDQGVGVAFVLGRKKCDQVAHDMMSVAVEGFMAAIFSHSQARSWAQHCSSIAR